MNPTSTDGNCSANSANNATCLTSTYGNCCSAKGYCGSTSAYCGAGCQPGYGKCHDASVQEISSTGSCGETATSNTTCLGSAYGDCCSGLGYCGGNSSYCGVGCQSLYGSCRISSGPSTTGGTATGTTTTTRTSTGIGATGTATQAISTDGSCSKAVTCLGSEWGDCCSGHGWCGGNASYCGVGCQPEFGRCNTAQVEGLGKGAIAGISVGAAVGGVLVVLGLGAWICRRRKTGRRYTAVVPGKGVADGDGDGSSLGLGLGQGQGPVEMAAATPGPGGPPFAVEIGQSRKVPVEIGQADVTYTNELDGRGRGAVGMPVELPAEHRLR